MRVLVLLKGSIYVGSSKEDPEVRSRKGFLLSTIYMSTGSQVRGSTF